MMVCRVTLAFQGHAAAAHAAAQSALAAAEGMGGNSQDTVYVLFANAALAAATRAAARRAAEEALRQHSHA